MRITTGIMEAQQNLSVLIEQVKAGNDVTITDGGEPVAVLTAPKIRREPKGFPDLSAFRESLGLDIDEAYLDKIMSEDREDRV